MSQILKTQYGTIQRNFFSIDNLRYQQIIKKDHQGVIIEDKTIRFHKKLKHDVSGFYYQYKHSWCKVLGCKCFCHIIYDKP